MSRGFYVLTSTEHIRLSVLIEDFEDPLRDAQGSAIACYDALLPDPSEVP